MLGFESSGIAAVATPAKGKPLKACFRISDNKFLEAQSDATPGTMIANAIRAGYAENDIEEREITDAELETILLSLAQ